MVDIVFKMVDGREVAYRVDDYRPIRAGMGCLRKDEMFFSDVADVFLNDESVMHVFIRMIDIENAKESMRGI